LDILYKLISNGVLELGNIFESCIRSLGWGLITLLAKLVNGIEKTANKVYTLNGFFNSTEINQLIDRYKPIVWTILAISIGILGFKIIFNRQQNRNELPSNILFSILVVVLLSTFMTKLNDITKFAIGTLNTTNPSITDTLVKESLYDIYYLDANNFNLEGEKNNISAENIYNIDINEALDTSNVKDSELFKKKIVFDTNGDKKLVKLEKGWFSIDEMYYRYNIDFIPVIISLGAIAIAFICIMLKVIRLLFELAFNKFFVTLLAFADISDSKKLKEMVKHIISIFVVIFITAVLTNMYMLYNSWLTKTLVNNGLGNNGILKILFIVGGAIAVIDGPNIVERILGIDAGLKSAWGGVMAGYGLAKGALNSGKALVSSGKALASGMSKLGNGLSLGMAGTGGAIAGMFGNKDKNKQGSDSQNNERDKKDGVNAEELKNNLDGKKQGETGNAKQEPKKASENNEADLDTLNDKFKDIEKSKNEGDKSNPGDNKKENSTGESLQEQMKASKNNESDLKSLNDKFKEIDELRNNPNKDFSKKNTNSDKSKDVDGQTVQEQIKANNNNSDNSNRVNAKENIKAKDIKDNTKFEDKSNISSKGQDIVENKTTSNNIKSENINSGKKEVKGNIEDRTIGQYMKDRVQGSRFADNVNRAYSLGYNTTSKWDIKNRNKNKKGENK